MTYSCGQPWLRMLNWVKIRDSKKQKTKTVFRCTGSSSTFDSRAERDALLAPRLTVENIQQMPFWSRSHCGDAEVWTAVRNGGFYLSPSCPSPLFIIPPVSLLSFWHSFPVLAAPFPSVAAELLAAELLTVSPICFHSLGQDSLLCSSDTFSHRAAQCNYTV